MKLNVQRVARRTSWELGGRWGNTCSCCRCEGRALATRLSWSTTRTQLTLTSRSYDYYDPGFGFCKPQDAPKQQSESLGSVLFGDRLYDSPFEVRTSLLARGSTS